MRKDCEGCRYEMDEAVYRLSEGDYLDFSWIEDLGPDHNPCYNNIGVWEVTEDDMLELGRWVAMDFHLQAGYPLHPFRGLKQNATPKHPNDYQWTGKFTPRKSRLNDFDLDEVDPNDAL